MERLSSHPSHHSPAGSTSTATLRQIPTTILELAASPTHEPVPPERRPRGDRDKERDRDRDKERGENGARPREHHKESRGGRLELLDLEPMDTSDPATQIMTNNYDMPILTESSQLSPSLSPDLEPVDTVHPAESLPHKFVSEKADPPPTHFITVSPKKKLVLGRMVEPPVSHPAPPSPEKRSRKLAMERRQRQKRDQQSVKLVSVPRCVD